VVHLAVHQASTASVCVACLVRRHGTWISQACFFNHVCSRLDIPPCVCACLGVTLSEAWPFSMLACHGLALCLWMQHLLYGFVVFLLNVSSCAWERNSRLLAFPCLFLLAFWSHSSRYVLLRGTLQQRQQADDRHVFGCCLILMLTGSLLSCLADVRPDQAADHPALDVAHGVPPPRAAPPLLRRVVLNELPSGEQIFGVIYSACGSVGLWAMPGTHIGRRSASRSLRAAKLLADRRQIN
jgi:hypothetical protein